MSGRTLTFASSDPRVRLLNGRPERKPADYVLYWSQIARRPSDNAALAFAIERANALRLPCLVYEALRADYPFASDRFHTFVLEGARHTAEALAARGIRYAFFLPRTAAEARGVLAKVAARAALVVSDDSPAFIVPAQNSAAAKYVDCSYVVVDDCAGLPLSLFPKEEYAARTLRPKVAKAMGDWLIPLGEPTPRVPAPERLDLPFEPLAFGTADIAKLVAACAIDHDVPPVLEFPGGAHAAEARLARFLRRGLAGYLVDRNEPSRDATSHLSPYLHFGMISARRVALAARDWARDSGASEPADAFLEQLLVRRGLAYNYALRNPAHASYDALPAWAHETLLAHRKDARPYVLSLAEMEDARTPDEVWNAAQLELRVRGVIHNYARMLWGKLVIPWKEEPRDAFSTLVYLNDKYALDGRDPDGYASIAWCFGKHDRPWPQRPVFGSVRSMTSRSARSKLDFEGYLDSARAWRRVV